jgi:hypothetical protein
MFASLFATTLLVTLPPALSFESAVDRLATTAQQAAPAPEAPAEHNLADWLTKFCIEAQVRCVADAEVMAHLKATQVTTFGPSLEDDPEAFLLTFQNLILTNGFILTLNRQPDHYQSHLPSSAPKKSLTPVLVDANDRQFMLDHPALLMATTVTPKWVDVRHLSVTLRGTLGQSHERVMATDSNALSLTATGAKLLGVLASVDAAVAARAANNAAVEGARTASAATEAPKGAGLEPLATRIFEINSEYAHNIVRTTERMVQARFNAGLAMRQWPLLDGNYLPWPQPRFYPTEDSKRVLVQGADKDMEMIAADLALAKRLFEGADADE